MSTSRLGVFASKCQNPLCGKSAPAWKKFCSTTCRNAAAQRNYRQRHGKPPVQLRDMFKKARDGRDSGASVERLKNRPLMCQEKQVAPAQALPAESGEFAKAIAERQAQEAEWFRVVEEKTRSLVAQERTVRNLRAVYESGTTFKMQQTTARRRWRYCSAIIEQNPGMFLSSFGDGPNDRCEHEYACEFLERELADEVRPCEHGKSWREECELCFEDISLEEVASWDQKQANTILAKLGLSVWQGKQAVESHYGHGRTVEGIDAGSHDRRPRRKGNRPDSFEKRGEESPADSGQDNSQPDPDYGGAKVGLGKAASAPLDESDNPQTTTQADLVAELRPDPLAEPLLRPTRKIQNLTTDEEKYARLDAENNCAESIANAAHQRIKESSTEAEVKRIVEAAKERIRELPGKEPDEDALPEERIEREEDESRVSA
jgi:hypothetical protein